MISFRLSVFPEYVSLSRFIMLMEGSLINNLLRNYLNKVVKDLQKQVIREINSGSWKSN